jgi:hypothetical protein
MDEHLARTTHGTALIGHNMHLSKASSAIRFGGPGEATPPRPMWRSIGTHLAESRPGEDAGVWMLYAGGTHGGHACNGAACTITPPSGVLEAELAKVGERFVVPPGDPASPPFAGDVRFMQNGELGSGEIARQADVFVFVRDVSAPSVEGAAELDAAPLR